MRVHDAHMLGVRAHVAAALPERSVNTHHGLAAIAYIMLRPSQHLQTATYGTMTHANSQPAKSTV